jgi:hypothetical protein
MNPIRVVRGARSGPKRPQANTTVVLEAPRHAGIDFGIVED